MLLTNAQKIIVRDWVNANRNHIYDQDTTDALNAVAAPDFIVWKTNVTVEEIMQNGFDWTRVDNLSVGKARIWEWMTRFGYFNPAKLNVQAGIEACWAGTAAELVAMRAAIYTHCKRQSSLIEKLLASGTGSSASPATMNFEGPVSVDDANSCESAV